MLPPARGRPADGGTRWHRVGRARLRFALLAAPMFAPRWIHPMLPVTIPGRRSTNALIPRWPSSWPLDATNITSRAGRAWQDPHQLQPARKASPSLARTPVPATPRRHDHEWRQLRIGASYLCGHIEGLGRCALDVSQYLDLDAALGLLPQKARMFAAHLEDWRTEGPQERVGVAGAQSRPAPRVTQTIALWRFFRRASPRDQRRPHWESFRRGRSPRRFQALQSGRGRPARRERRVKQGKALERRSAGIQRSSSGSTRSIENDSSEAARPAARFLAAASSRRRYRPVWPSDGIPVPRMPDDPTNTVFTNGRSRTLLCGARTRHHPSHRVQSGQLQPVATADLARSFV